MLSILYIFAGLKLKLNIAFLFAFQEKEFLNETKKLEMDFCKEFNKVKEDLRLEDSKVILFKMLMSDWNFYNILH